MGQRTRPPWRRRLTRWTATAAPAMAGVQAWVAEPAAVPDGVGAGNGALASVDLAGSWSFTTLHAVTAPRSCGTRPAPAPTSSGSSSPRDQAPGPACVPHRAGPVTTSAVAAGISAR
ncbi:hypothetical protein [Amycolatopsis sp. NPDC051716]|uniref:hypothetical protein n=1 Tax=Amycolatopsis sp. NPDC051716 TaxID=3155804 RepID=UPI003440B65E